jgi:hypothetical protein
MRITTSKWWWSLTWGWSQEKIQKILLQKRSRYAIIGGVSCVTRSVLPLLLLAIAEPRATYDPSVKWCFCFVNFLYCESSNMGSRSVRVSKGIPLGKHIGVHIPTRMIDLLAKKPIKYYLRCHCWSHVDYNCMLLLVVWKRYLYNTLCCRVS